jgi:hypothetical protein
MTKVQAIRPQRVPLTPSSYIGGTWQPASPLETMTVMQTAVEDARERIEETQVLPLSAEGVREVMELVRSDLLDWNALEEAERADGGWGG